ncbi:ammonium transporter [Vulcanisaeta souniana]|uniref:Ammonium transporter n=1 Tax=Vulcanisaeta souniana JCM 11219 TaxID=1293586 RepID=A0A830E5V3_9CREN|nr:ammonium transporter [Vulcanisaeta souniana]BDR92298.1 ammonium transporter [Vulcanisaeta souniana JCM 11219]GGI74525.1 ammonium transporter [Vulcanisaeta souniana JCM 11219]
MTVLATAITTKANALPNLSGYPQASVPTWLDTGSNAWMLTAATLVGLQSVPGLMLLYGGMTKRKYAINTMMMVLYAFAIVLIIWVLAGYMFAFGPALVSVGGFNVLGMPIPALSSSVIASQASVPAAQQYPNIAMSTLIFFQFVFAAITPALMVGALIERMNFKAWMLFVPLWSLLVYSPVAFWLWGGGWLMQLGVVDFSGGYVIHVDAGIAAFVAAAMVGERLVEERKLQPHNLTQVAAGLGLVWLGWNGFNGGDPYGSTIDAAIAVINTNLATAVAVVMWMLLDTSYFGKPTFTGAVSGAVAGLVGITPAAGYINGVGSIIIGALSSAAAWYSLNFFQFRSKLTRNIDDALGVFSDHAVPGIIGGILTGIFADPNITKYVDPGLRGALYGDPYQVLLQLMGVAVVVVYDVVMTYLILKLIGRVTPLRASIEELRIGDKEMHGEVAYDEFAFATQGDAERMAAGVVVSVFNKINDVNDEEK